MYGIGYRMETPRQFLPIRIDLGADLSLYLLNAAGDLGYAMNRVKRLEGVGYLLHRLCQEAKLVGGAQKKFKAPSPTARVCAISR